MVCENPAKIGDHMYCGTRETMFLAWHVISQNHMIKGLCDYTDRNTSR